MTDQFDDDTEAEVSTTGVPPAPSVTPGPNPPPASAIDEAAEQRGCVAVLIVGAVLAIIALVLSIALVVIGLRIFGESDESANAKILQEVYSETGISSTTGDAVHPPQRDIQLGVCESDGGDGVKAAGTLTNWTNESADYEIDVSFRTTGPGSTGEEFAASSITVKAVPEHSTTNWSASAPRPTRGAYACRVVTVNRWPAGTAPPS